MGIIMAAQIKLAETVSILNRTQCQMIKIYQQIMKSISPINTIY